MFYLSLIKSVLLIHLGLGQSVVYTQTFMASFQTDLDGAVSASPDVWIQFLNRLHSSKEFTSCFWIKTKFYNLDIAVNLWSYCTVEKSGDKMRCLQLFMHGNEQSANRDLVFGAYIPARQGNKKISMAVNSFLHRTWVHFCWSFSDISGENKFYYNGMLLGIAKVNGDEIEMPIKDATKMYDAAFIFGQEPDNMRGGFDSDQAFLGDLSELNLWNYTMNDMDIMAMALCKDWRKGNLVAWERSNLVLNNVIVTDLPNSLALCSLHRQYVIFPEKVRYPEAKENCEIHGGTIAVPQSEEENNKIMDIVFKHMDTCIDKEKLTDGNAVWIGAKKVNHKWYEVGATNTIGRLLNYTNLLKSTTNPYSECGILRNDGAWVEGYFACTQVSLCTVCYIINEPVFTLKGICYIGEADYNYYISVDTKNEIQLYEGYKKTNIIFNKDNQNWNIFTKPGYPQTFIAEFLPNKFTTKYPVGRRQWFINDKLCGIEDKMHALSLSICNFPTQFTCDSGQCININKRCDERKDCSDGSDEKNCSLVIIPSSYNKANAPEPNPKSNPLEIIIQASVMNIDSIDTVNMIVTLTLEIHIKWRDERLTFSNPIIDKDNIIPIKTAHELWTPLRDLFHENAIIGEIQYETNNNVIKIKPTVPEDIDASHATENRLFNGSYNSLQTSRRMKIKYNCIFRVKKFPFDGQNCSFIMGISHSKESTVSFVEDGDILQNGLSNVDQFAIGKMSSKINNTNEFTKYIIIIPMDRIFTNQLLITFIPTSILWLFGYSTLFIDTENRPSDRFMGAGTALLVTATLLNGVYNDLPKTSYMKYIDVWFLWHVGSIFAMIIYHVILDRARQHFEQTNNKYVLPYKTTDFMALMKKHSTKKITKINNRFIIVFPILNSLFYGMYLYFTMN